ncbi:MAG: 2-oxoisovalerate dehydrogenase [Bacteroidia bacterium]|nr:2-oxoisovalerate dehydrogenase [Bacteroidia bacterium]
MEKEILFTLEKSAEGIYSAKDANSAITASGKTIEEVKLNAWDAVICKFEGKAMPSIGFAN